MSYLDYAEIKKNLEKKINVTKNKIQILNELKQQNRNPNKQEMKTLSERTPLKQEEIALILNYKSKAYEKRGKNYQATILKEKNKKLINTIKQNVDNNLPFKYDLIAQNYRGHCTPVHIDYNGKKLNFFSVDAAGVDLSSIYTLLDFVDNLDKTTTGHFHAFTKGGVQKDNFSCSIFSIQDLDSMLKLENKLDQYLPRFSDEEEISEKSQHTSSMHPRFLKNAQSLKTINEYQSLITDKLDFDVTKGKTLEKYIDEHSIKISEDKTRNYAITHKSLKYLEAAKDELENIYTIGGEKALDELLNQKTNISPYRVPVQDFQKAFEKLQLSTKENFNELVNSLLPSVNSQDKNLQTLLHLAAQEGDVKTAQLLLQCNKVNPNMIDYNGQTPLHIAAEKQDTKMIETLLVSNDIKFLQDLKNKTPIDYIKQLDNNNTVSLAHSKNNILDSEETNLLHNALLKANESFDDLFAALLQNPKIDPNQINNAGKTLIQVAIENGSNDTVKMLLENEKINLNQVDGKGQSLLHIAASVGNSEITKILLNRIDPNVIDNEGQTPLHVAAKEGSLGALKVLLDKVDPNVIDNFGQTPLHIAAREDLYDGSTISALVENKKTNLNLTDINEQTPLHIAAQAGNWRATMDLLKSDNIIDLSIKDKNRKTALDIAREKNNREVLGYFEKYYETMSKNNNILLKSNENLVELVGDLPKVEGISISSHDGLEKTKSYVNKIITKRDSDHKHNINLIQK